MPCSPKSELEFGVTKEGYYEKTPLKLSCNATNGSWKFCRWAKGDDMTCTYKYEYIQESGKWIVTKCADSKQTNCKECNPAFKDFQLIQKDRSKDGNSNRMCEIRKQSAEMKIDDGEYVCLLLKCATPEDGGCKFTPERFQKYDIMQTELNHSVKIQVFVNSSLYLQFIIRIVYDDMIKCNTHYQF